MATARKMKEVGEAMCKSLPSIYSPHLIKQIHEMEKRAIKEMHQFDSAMDAVRKATSRTGEILNAFAHATKKHGHLNRDSDCRPDSDKHRYRAGSHTKPKRML